MLRCKVLVGGYHDSSDDESGLDTDSKRAKPTLHAPPRLTAVSRLGFQLPGSSGPRPHGSIPLSRQVSVASSSGRPTPVPESMHSTPEVQIGKSFIYLARTCLFYSFYNLAQPQNREMTQLSCQALQSPWFLKLQPNRVLASALCSLMILTNRIFAFRANRHL
jgi:hypothetical protein